MSLIKISGAFICALVAFSAGAEGLRPGTWALNPGSLSHHFNVQSGERNPYNYALGLHYQWTEDAAFDVGVYNNSHNRSSRFLFVGYHPFDVYNTKIGFTTGYVSGYKKDAEGNIGNGYTFIIIPSWTYTFRDCELYGLYFPRVGRHEGLATIGVNIPFESIRKWFR